MGDNPCHPRSICNASPPLFLTVPSQSCDSGTQPFSISIQAPSGPTRLLTTPPVFCLTTTLHLPVQQSHTKTFVHRYLPRGPTVCPAFLLKLAVISPRAAGGCWYQTPPGIQWSTGAWLNPGFPLRLESRLVRLAPSPRRSVSGAGAQQHGHHQKSLFLLTGAWGRAPLGCTTFLSFPWPFQAIMFFSTPSSNL